MRRQAKVKGCIGAMVDEITLLDGKVSLYRMKGIQWPENWSDLKDCHRQYWKKLESGLRSGFCLSNGVSWKVRRLEADMAVL